MFTDLVFNIQTVLLLALGVAAFGLEVWALVEACRFKGPAYPAAGKQTKPMWVAITAVATAIGFIYVRNPIGGFLSIIAVAAAAIFIVSVRPALRQISGRGGGSSSGGYGSW